MSAVAEARVSSWADARGSKSWVSALDALGRAYGHPRRSDGRRKLDQMLLALLAEERGERVAGRWLDEMLRRFVDCNEIRVARTRDLTAVVPEVPPTRLVRMQGLLQALYESQGGLDVSALVAMKPAEARVWLAALDVLEREELDAVLMVALGAPVLPASAALSRVARRLGLAGRKATRVQAHRLASENLAPRSYREFYSLAAEHAAGRCREEKPECGGCGVRPLCRSKGRW